MKSGPMGALPWDWCLNARSEGTWGRAVGGSREEGGQWAWQSWDSPDPEGPQGSLRECTTATRKAGPTGLLLFLP